MSKVVRYVFLSLLVLTGAACSQLQTFFEEPLIKDKVVNKNRPPQRARVMRPANSEPFQLEVLDEQFDGEDLVLTVGFVSFEPVDYDATVLRLTTLDQGELIKEKIYPIAELQNAYGGDEHALGTRYKYGLVIPAKENAEYQLELLWGREALPFLSEKQLTQMAKNMSHESELQKTENVDNVVSNKSQALKTGTRMTDALSDRKSDRIPLPEADNAKLEGVRISKKRFCGQSKCEIEFLVQADVVNTSLLPVEGLRLAVGFLDKESEQYRNGVRVPLDEEVVHLAGVRLNPNESQPLSMALDQRIPESMEKRYLPVVRLVAEK